MDLGGSFSVISVTWEVSTCYLYEWLTPSRQSHLCMWLPGTGLQPVGTDPLRCFRGTASHTQPEAEPGATFLGYLRWLRFAAQLSFSHSYHLMCSLPSYILFHFTL